MWIQGSRPERLMHTIAQLGYLTSSSWILRGAAQQMLQLAVPDGVLRSSGAIRQILSSTQPNPLCWIACCRAPFPNIDIHRKAMMFGLLAVMQSGYG